MAGGDLYAVRNLKVMPTRKKVEEERRKSIAGIGGPKEPDKLKTISLAVGNTDSPQSSNQNTKYGLGKDTVKLKSSSTTSVGYDPTADLAQKRAEMEKVYGSGDESFATKLIASRQKQRERTAATQFGLTPEEMEAGKMPESGDEEGLYGDKLNLYEDMEETKNNLSNMYKERLKVLQGYKDKAGNKVAGSLDRIQNSLTQAEQEVQKAFQEIKNADLDPMKGVPMWAIALIGLGAGLQEMGRKGAGNATVGVLNSVIKQRQDQKRLELQKLFDVHKLSTQQREYLSEIFERRLSEQSNLMKNIAIMDEAKLAIREKSLDYQISVADKINALAASKAEDQFNIRAKGLEEMNKAKDFEIRSKTATASKTTSGYREVLPKKGDDSGLKLTADAKNKFKQSLAALDQIYKLRKSYLENKPWKYSFWGTLKNSKRYQADLNRATAAYVYSVSGAQASDSERREHKKTFAQGFGPGELGQKEGLYKLNQHIEQVASELAITTNMYPQLKSAIPQKFQDIVEQNTNRLGRKALPEK